LQLLQVYKGEARIIAGGTDLIIELKDQKKKVKCLIDISEIEQLRKIELKGDAITIGAGITHSQVASSELIWEKATLLAEATSAIGSPLTRNQGTVVGNVVNAQPAADAAVALFALEAKLEILSSSGTEVVPIEDLYQTLGVSRVDSTSEIVTALHLKGLQNNQGSAFLRLAQRKALALPMLNVAVVLSIKNGRYEETRIVLAPVAPLPFRSKKAEEVLKGASIGPESIDRAVEVSASEARPRDSALRGSADYRREMVKVLLRRALGKATQRAEKGNWR
jgi:carbon-monoxide dehydrogenase medium subunit